MESSVKTISRPVIGRLPVTQLDEFACRQLDRVRAFFFNRLIDPPAWLSDERGPADQTFDLRNQLVYLTSFHHSSASMAAVSRGTPSKRNSRRKQRPRHQKENLASDPVLRGRVLVVPPLLDQKLSNRQLSRGAVGKPCFSKLADSEPP